MTNFIDKPQTDDIIRLSGVIKNYRCTRASASFVYNESDQRQLGVIAVAAALAGMGGQAASTVGEAADVEESADYLEFDLNGQSLKGWVWRSPFQNGDQVTVAAQSQRDHYEIYGVARPADRTISLYPHCSRSKRRHIRNAVKWWVIFNVLIFGPLSILMLQSHGPEVFLEPGIFWFNVVLIAFFILMFVSLTRQYMPFVRLAQKVFLALELPDAKNIDLVKSSSKQRVISDPPEFGTFYFRY